MKKVIWCILIGILVLALVLAISFATRQGKLLSPEESCAQFWGEWVEFPDTCANTCAYERESDQYCTQVLTFSCLCESGECWNGKSCVPI